MNLDINTLLAVTVANIIVLALVSAAVIGARPGPAANAARWSVAVHALSWVCMITSNFWPETLMDRVLSTLSVGGFAATHWLLFRALVHWLGPRHGEKTVTLLAWLTPIGYGLMFSHYGWRVGWSNFLLAAQLLLLALACFAPRTALRGNWRLVIALGTVSMAVLTFGRGFLGAFTDLYPSFLTPHPWNVAAMLTTNLLPLMINYAVLGGWHEEAEIALHQQAVTDAMTGLFNRRGWIEVGQPLIANANRIDQPMALLMFDIDFFKKINDTHGHEAGDRALQAVGRLILEHRRANDLAARIGGEEFALLLPGSTAESAQAIDQHLRERLPAIGEQLGFPIDFSSGLATRRPGETLESLMIRADAALYGAKTGGRGRLVCV